MKNAKNLKGCFFVEKNKSVTGKSFDAIDFCKFIFSIAVIALHTNFLGNYNENISFFIISIWCRLAVPFFFAVTGFLLCLKLIAKKEQSAETIKKQCYRMTLLWALWSGIKFIHCILRGIIKQENIINIVKEYIKNIIILQDGNLWYIQILILSLPLFYLFYKNNKTVVFFVLSLILYETRVVFSYLSLFESSFTPLYNMLENTIFFFDFWRSCVFISVGTMVAIKYANINKDKIFNQKEKIWLIVAIPIFLLEILSIIIYSKDRNIAYFALFPLIIYCFLCFLVDSKVKINKARLFRELSILMYVSHYLVRSVCHPLHNISSLLYFFATLVLTVLFSYSIIVLSKQYKVLKYLY